MSENTIKLACAVLKEQFCVRNLRAVDTVNNDGAPIKALFWDAPLSGRQQGPQRIISVAFHELEVLQADAVSGQYVIPDGHEHYVCVETSFHVPELNLNDEAAERDYSGDAKTLFYCQPIHINVQPD